VKDPRQYAKFTLRSQELWGLCEKDWRVMSLARGLTAALSLTAAAIADALKRQRETMSLATRLTAALIALVAITVAAIGVVT